MELQEEQIQRQIIKIVINTQPCCGCCDGDNSYIEEVLIPILEALNRDLVNECLTGNHFEDTWVRHLQRQEELKAFRGDFS